MKRRERGSRWSLGVAVMATVATAASWATVWAGGPGEFSYQVLARLGEKAPAGTGFRINDFEPGGINNRGDVLFGNDLGTASDPAIFYGEGIFLKSKGQESVLAHATAPAPGGGTFAFLFLGPVALNDPGDAAVGFTLSTTGRPFDIASPVGVLSGVYRYSHTGKATAVVVPFVTPAPEGGVFAGVSFGPNLNNGGDLVFPGIVPTAKGIHLSTEPYIGLGLGIYQADKQGRISRVVIPGDAAPGGGTFDFAVNPWVNDGGDVAFAGHIAGEEVNAPPTQPPQAAIINALGSAYVKDGATGKIRSIAHAGELAPGGGVFRGAFSPVINDEGEIVFLGDLTPPPNAGLVTAVFLYSKGTVFPVARPGDLMPGGGQFVTASTIGGNQVHINNPGEIVFNAVLNTDVDGNQIPDTGLYARSHDALRLVARTGTVIPGVGTISDLVMGEIVVPPSPGFVPNSGAVSNDKGEVLFGATLSNGLGVLVVATPK